MNKYLTEFIGTFFLVLTICLTVIKEVPMAPLAIGCSLMIMVYMGGHISGAHYNPAVTLAVCLRGKLPAAQVIPYWIAQIAGAIAASAMCLSMIGKTFALAPGADVPATRAILNEFLGTFMLALVVLNVATAKGTAGNSFYGLAIGFAVVVGAFAGGGISGGAYNPAVAIGPNLMHMLSGGGSMSHIWIYMVGCFAGGAVAAIVFKIQNPDDAATPP
jgi:aquaporin Z